MWTLLVLENMRLKTDQDRQWKSVKGPGLCPDHQCPTMFVAFYFPFLKCKGKKREVKSDNDQNDHQWSKKLTVYPFWFLETNVKKKQKQINVLWKTNDERTFSKVTAWFSSFFTSLASFPVSSEWYEVCFPHIYWWNLLVYFKSAAVANTAMQRFLSFWWVLFDPVNKWVSMLRLFILSEIKHSSLMNVLQEPPKCTFKCFIKNDTIKEQKYKTVVRNKTK